MTSGSEIGAISVRIGADISDLSRNLGQASSTLRSTSDEMEADLGLLGSRASSVFDGLGGTIARAATGGRNSVRGMVDGMLAEFSRLAVKSFITKPLDNLIGQIFSSLPLAGARATGGPVGAGGTYLVGEQGPELFVPRTSGTIVPQARGIGGVTVNIYAQDAQSVMQSETQISAMLARASRRGMRNL